MESHQIDSRGVHNDALEGRSGHIFGVELELNDVRLRLFRHERDGVRMVALRLGARWDLTVVDWKNILVI